MYLSAPNYLLVKGNRSDTITIKGKGVNHEVVEIPRQGPMFIFEPSVGDAFSLYICSTSEEFKEYECTTGEEFQKAIPIEYYYSAMHLEIQWDEQGNILGLHTNPTSINFHHGASKDYSTMAMRYGKHKINLVLTTSALNPVER